MNRRPVIVDSGGANIASLRFALARQGVDAELSTDPAVIAAASHVFLPGVGAAEDAMKRLADRGLTGTIADIERPVLGICLGMQLLYDYSQEDDARCLGLLPGGAALLHAGAGTPVPHMGWNRIESERNDPLLDGIPGGTRFYFLHSYAAATGDDTVASTEYGSRFSAVVRRGNFCGTQFHPERSGEAGARLLKNFLEIEA